MTSSTSAFQAQMSGTPSATYPSTTTSSCSNGGILSGDPRPRHGDRAAADCVQQSKSSQGEAQSSGTVLRHHQSNEGGPQGSTDVGRPVAMLQPSHPLRPGGECARTVDNVQCLQRESTVHTKEGITSIVDSSAQRTDGVADAQGTSPTSGQCTSYLHMMNKITEETVLEKSIREILDNPTAIRTAASSPSTAWGMVDDEELVAAYENETWGE